MISVFRHAESILRHDPWATHPTGRGKTTARLAVVIIVFGMIYGAVLGSYGGIFGDRWMQIIFAAIKVPLLLGSTFVICLPIFFVMNNLLGLRDDFIESIRALMATQAGVAVILASFAPYTALWYASVDNYNMAILFNAVMFGAASLTGQGILRYYYGPLIRRNRNHRVMLYIWLGLYAFVGIQMGWILRPFVGSLDSAITFFREDTFGNAYMVIIRLVTRIFY